MQSKETVETIIRNGLFTTEPEPHFSGRGCDTCEPRLAGTVYSGQGFLDLESAQTDKENFYEFQVCADCLNRLYYGE